MQNSYRKMIRLKYFRVRSDTTLNMKFNRKIHAYVKWFKSTPNHQMRFHFQINDDAQSCNVKLWSDELFDISRDCIIPVHNILDRFIPCSCEIGKRNPITCMAVIPLGKKFHM